MKNIIEYKGYIGTVGISEKDHSFGGHLLNVDDAYVSYVGRNYKELIQVFHEMVDAYIEDKTTSIKKTAINYNGNFNVRVKPELHRDAVVFAKEHRTSLNKLIEAAIKEKIYAQN